MKRQTISVKGDATSTPIDPANSLTIRFEMEIDLKSERGQRVLETFGRLLRECLTEAEADQLLAKLERARKGSAK
jgi:hypothetical protein